MEITDITVNDDRSAEVFRVISQLRPHLNESTFREIYAAAHPQGLRFTAVFEGDRCTAVAGWRILDTLHYVRKLYIDDLVTDEFSRSGGHGHALMVHLTEVARQAGCNALDLDSGVHRFDAHRFYLRERMHISAHHFVLPITSEEATTP